MDPEIRQLYQQLILDHGKSPRHYGPLEPHTHSAEGYNPLCGDHIELFLNLDGDQLQNLSFQGNGCAISRASCSLMIGALKGKTRKEYEDLFSLFHQLLTEDNFSVEEHEEELGKLTALGGVKEFPMRVKCATLAWHTLKAALENKENKEKNKKVTTE